MAEPTLTLLAGLPASGKSTWAKANADGALVLSADTIRTQGKNAHFLFERMYRSAAKALRNGQSVIVDTCALRRMDRLPWLKIARKAGAQTRLVIADTKVEVCRARNRARAHKTSNFEDFATRWRLFDRFVVKGDWGEIMRVKRE